MNLSPYTTEFAGHITYRCRVVADDGRTLDLKGAADSDWSAMAQAALAAVDVVTEPETAKQDSPIEAEFKRERDAFKVAAIGFVHQARDCSLEDVLAACAGVAPMINTAPLIQTYIAGAAQQGLIAEPTFEAFREFVAGLTLDQLMEM